MKQFAITCCLLFLLSTAFGQNIIEKHFSTYKSQPEFTSIHVSSKAFELSAYLDFEDTDEDFAEFKDFLSTVNSFDMIAGDELEVAGKKYQAALKKVQASHEELMTVSENGGEFTFLIDETNGIVKELVMVGTQKDKLAIFSLTGNMDLNQLSKMSSMMKDAGGAELEKMFENGIHEVKVYPNPISTGEELSIELPEDMNSGTVNLLNLNGAKVRSFEITSNRHTLKTNGLAAGNYILELNNGQVSIKRKLVIR